MRVGEKYKVTPQPSSISGIQIEFVTLAEQGQRHEQTARARLQAEGCDVYTVPVVGDRIALTVATMQADREVIY